MKCRFGILIIVSLIVASSAISVKASPDTERIIALLDAPPQPILLEIEYRAVSGQAKLYEWHIGQSTWWVRLHPKERYDVEKLDNKNKYIVKGIVLEQNYGAVDVWVKSIQEKKEK